MSAWRIHHHPPSDSTPLSMSSQLQANLSLTTSQPVPNPGRGEVLIRMKAAAVNYRDLVIAVHSPDYPGDHVPGLMPCADGAGVIEEMGEDVERWTIGDEVLLCPQHSWLSGDISNFTLPSVYGGSAKHGTLTQYLVAPTRWLLRKPTNLTLAEAASLPTAAATAVQALFYSPPPPMARVIQEGNMAPFSAAGFDLTGKTILTMGTGGVSVFAVQFAKAAGARVVATTSSTDKMEVLKKLGADVVINYKEHVDWELEVLKATGGKGVDLVMEVGGAGTLMKSLKSTRTGGVVVLVGILTQAEKGALDGVVPEALYGAKTLVGNLSASLEMQRAMVELVEKHDIHPVIGKTFEWENGKEAFVQLAAQNTIGKIIVHI